MHETWFRILEVLVYTLINTLPYHFCVLYVFQEQRRFRLSVTLLILIPSVLLELALHSYVIFGGVENSSLVNLIWSAGYLISYWIVIREPVGKTSFVMLVLLTLNNFNIVASKCLESYLFPAFAMERFHFSNALTMLITELLTVAPHFVTLRRRYVPAMKRSSNTFLWRYLWLIPATFYFLWHYHIHFDSASSLEVATDPHAIMFLFIINCGSYLIYYIVLRLINESANNAELRSSNHQLELQTLQFENLQERIAETRKANHDLRHHITVMQGYLKNDDYTGLQNYFSTVKRLLPSSTVHFCKHNTLNMLLAYFDQLAKEHHIEFSAHIHLPESLPIPDHDLAVLIGNLTENAVEACSAQQATDKRILICGQQQGNRLLFTIDNTFERAPRQDRSGVYLSSKHSGQGIGIESAKAIARRYNGQLQIRQVDNMFCVSIAMELT